MKSEVITLQNFADYLSATSFELDESGTPATPLIFVDLSGDIDSVDIEQVAINAAAIDTCIFVGLAQHPVDSRLRTLLEALAFTLVEGATATDATNVRVLDLGAARETLTTAILAVPRAALTLTSLLRLTAKVPVRDGLLAESLAFSMLLAGPEFAHWMASRRHNSTSSANSLRVIQVEREGEVLTITLNNPSRHNALDRELRDGLVAAFDASINDSTITRIRLCGSGASFCSGGELNEFGSNQDLAVAHLIRLDRSIATRVEKCRDRVEVELHGACFGAGIEIPSFAGKITARDDTVIQLPEVSMGLVPGAGGTVGITRRIGRWRMAYLAITGEPIGRDTALEWGLVDERRL